MTEAQLLEFLRRIDINVDDVPEATFATLEKIAQQFVMTIPFEQLDVALERDIATEPVKIFEKIVQRRRGGFCFENNVLLYEVLVSLGFDCKRHLGRVVIGGNAQGSNHMLISVTFDNKTYLMDGGFGGCSMRRPLDLSKINGEPQLCYPEIIRLIQDNEKYVGRGGIRMQVFDATKWVDEHAMTEECWLDQWASNLSDPVFDCDIAQKAFVVSKRIQDNWFTNSRLVVLLSDHGHRYLQKDKFIVKERRRYDDIFYFFPDLKNFTDFVLPKNDHDGPIWSKTSIDVANAEYINYLAAEFGIYDLGDNIDGNPIAFDDFPLRCL